MYDRESRGIWRVCFAAVVLAAIPATLCAQTDPLTRQADAGANQPFLTFDNSLATAADTLLASPPVAVPPTAKAVGDDTPGLALDLRVDGHRSLPDGGLTLAATRLDLLRPTVEPILRSHGVPTELAAVILVESGGHTTALSPKGARGLWQLMPDTARRYGLRVDEMRDDRLDLFRATDAAARYLHDLYAQFSDWRLALAAYNTGEANVGSAILRAHTQDFDQLTSLRVLPLETRNYVPRVLAAAQFTGQRSALVKDHDAVGATTVFAVTSR